MYEYGSVPVLRLRNGKERRECSRMSKDRHMIWFRKMCVWSRMYVHT